MREMDRSLLPAISAFVVVAREESFTRAAPILAVSPSALSQTIRFLEAQLQVRLLHRSTRSVSVTEEGKAFLERVAPALTVIAEAVNLLEESQVNPKGTIRIKTPRLAASHFVEPFLGDFSRRYPNLRLEMVVDDGVGDIVREGFDAGIQLRQLLPESMIAVPIGPQVSMALVGSPEYFRQNSPPLAPADLDLHNCLGCRFGTDQCVMPWVFFNPESNEKTSIVPIGSFITNSDESITNAALQGVGLVMHLDFAVKAHVESGQLIRVLQDWTPPVEEFNLYFKSRAHLPLKVRSLIDFLSEKRRETT